MLFGRKYLREGESDKKGGDAGSGVKPPELPLDKKPEGTPTNEWEIKAKAYEEKLAKIESDSKKKSDDEKKAKQKADDDKRIADGESQKVIAEKDKELADERAKREALEKVEIARMEKTIASLSDSAKKRIELVRKSLPLDKLSELVDAEAESVSTTPNNPKFANPSGKGGTPGIRKLHEKTYQVLKENKVRPDVAEKYVEYVESDSAAGGGIFRIPVDTLIEQCESIAIKPTRLSIEEYQRAHRK